MENAAVANVLKREKATAIVTPIWRKPEFIISIIRRGSIL